MDLSLSEELHQFSQELQCFLSPVVLQDIARQVGFVQRSSKYQANELIGVTIHAHQPKKTDQLQNKKSFT